MFNRLERESRLLTKDWSKYTGRYIIFKSKNISEEELRVGMWKVGKTCNSFSNCLKRSLRRIKLGIKHAMFTMQSNFYQMKFLQNRRFRNLILVILFLYITKCYYINKK